MAAGSKLERFPLRARRLQDARDADAGTGDPVAPEQRLTTLLAGQLLDDGPAACILGDGNEIIYSNKAFHRIKRALAAVGALPDGNDGLGSEAPFSGHGEERTRLTLLLGGRREHFELERRVLGSDAASACAYIYEPVTSREAISVALARTTTRLDDLARLVSDWIWETDRELCFSYVSPRVTEILGFHPRELEGLPLIDIAAEPADRLNKLVMGRGRSPFRNIEVEVESALGERHIFRLSGLPVYHPETGTFEGLRGTAEDVTDLRCRERALIEAKETAELADRAKTEFLANMSHELRTPLNAVIGFSELMETELLGPLGNEQYKSYAKDIHDSARHLLKIINDILDVAKIEAGGQQLAEEQFDPAVAAQTVVRLIAARCQNSKQQLRSDLADGLPHLFADERMIKQVLLNLLSNAAKFTPDGGSIQLSAGLEADGSFAFVVKDNGIGIEQEDMDRVFAPFQQIDSRISRQYEGTGLGLALSLSFMRLHGGELALESKPGLGTMAIARLPADRVVAGD